jgi:hypothetical protein
MNGRVVIFVGHQDQREEVDAGAFMYCSATGWCFGPLFDSADDCREFMDWVDKDKGTNVELRQVPTKELYELHSRWLVETRRAT